ncbi:MAG: hypothetical protein PHQ36_09665 [Anaerolineales bacterium]|nr:hypothetical protein [Anaerolineales bacterium]
MSRFTRIYVSYILVVLAALACSIDFGVVPDSGKIGTSIVETVIASLTGTAPAAATMTLPPTLTHTPETPTLTPTQTLTSTPVFTFTPLIPQISVSVNTNCRAGPGKAYPIVGAFTVGVSTQIYGRDATGEYWYIRNPDYAYDFCWVWGEYATITGNVSTVPIFTPPPTPTPTHTFTPTATFTALPAAKFNAAYKDLATCNKKWWNRFAVKNVGDYAFRSMTIVVQDIKNNVTVSRTANGFQYVNNCAWSTSLAVLRPGKSTFISSAPFGYDLTNRNLRAWIVLCVQPNQGGACVQRTLNFKP